MTMSFTSLTKTMVIRIRPITSGKILCSAASITDASGYVVHGYHVCSIIILWSIKRNGELLSITVANLHRLHPQYAGMRIFINNTLARVLWMYRVCCIFIRETQRQYAFCRTFYLLSLFACLCTGKDSAQVPPIGVRSLRDCRSIIQTEILPIWWRYL